MSQDEKPETLRLERERDNQQWALDYIIKTSGIEINFEPGERRYPEDVKSHAMIPRVMYRRGKRKEELARAADEAGHGETAMGLYSGAVEDYRHAQHAIFEDDNPDKILIWENLDACYDRIVALSGNTTERVEVAFEDGTLSGLLHLAPGDGPRPLLLFCPGMDMTKEAFPSPRSNPYRSRGIHVLSIDGPGQGSANLRKIRVTVDNYEKAASAFLDAVVDRPEVDAGRIGVSGRSMGSYWGMRIAASDERVAAVGTSVANYGTKRDIFERSSPRFKQIFMYMAGIHDEREFDRLADQMTLHGVAEQVTCPTLMVTGEYDPLTSLFETEETFEAVRGPKELWLLEDAFHPLRDLPNLGEQDIEPFLADWMRDALAGLAPETSPKRVFFSRDGLGPYSDEVPGFWLKDREG